VSPSTSGRGRKGKSMISNAEVKSVSCPKWCARRHGEQVGEEDGVHVSGTLQVRRTILRLAATVDPETGAKEGPFILVGPDEYTLHEADVLIAALTQLVDEGRGEVTPPAVPRMRPAGR
jgi:hypothetical protein